MAIRACGFGLIGGLISFITAIATPNGPGFLGSALYGACNALMGCAAAVLPYVLMVIPGIGGFITAVDKLSGGCLSGAIAGAAGTILGALCNYIPGCGGPPDWQCVFKAALFSAAAGCFSAWLPGGAEYAEESNEGGATYAGGIGNVIGNVACAAKTIFSKN